jgi:tetratricopeptide (TPR) repeat protein
MNQFSDTLGNQYTASSQTSVASMDTVLDAYLGSKATVMPLLEGLIEVDPQMPMAQCLRAYMLKLAGDPRFKGPIGTILVHLTEQTRALNTREQLHLRALTSWVANQLIDTVKILESLLSSYPKDMLALRIAHYLHFYAGGAVKMRDSVARSVAVWHDTDPYYGYLLGMHSFGLEESGDYAGAEALGRQAIDIDPSDIWAGHAVTHVLQMQQRYSEGIPWIESLAPHWGTTNNFAYHLYWHKALFYLGTGELDAALALYDQHLVDVLTDDFYLDICNAASLLWRLEMRGINVGQRWHALQSLSAARVTDDELIFSTLHYLMTPARLNDQPAIDRALEHLRDWSQANTSQGDICRDVGLPVANALINIGLGESRKAADQLQAVQDKLYLIGGSHAQRDLFTQIQHYCATA